MKLLATSFILSLLLIFTASSSAAKIISHNPTPGFKPVGKSKVIGKKITGGVYLTHNSVFVVEQKRAKRGVYSLEIGIQPIVRRCYVNGLRARIRVSGKMRFCYLSSAQAKALYKKKTSRIRVKVVLVNRRIVNLNLPLHRISFPDAIGV